MDDFRERERERKLGVFMALVGRGVAVGGWGVSGGIRMRFARN